VTHPICSVIFVLSAQMVCYYLLTCVCVSDVMLLSFHMCVCFSDVMSLSAHMLSQPVCVHFRCYVIFCSHVVPPSLCVSVSDAGAPVYLYQYHHAPQFLKEKRPSFVGADHGDEMILVLGFCFTTQTQLTGE
jgi:hypothetical protein